MRTGRESRGMLDARFEVQSGALEEEKTVEPRVESVSVGARSRERGRGRVR